MGRPALFAMSYMVGHMDKRMNNKTMFPTLKSNAAASSVQVQGPVKIEVLKGAGLQNFVDNSTDSFVDKVCKLCCITKL